MEKTRLKVDALGEDEQLEVMRYWVSEANKARRNIAFIRVYEKNRKRYVDSRSNPEEIKNPAYNAVGKVPIALLDVVLDSLIAFSFKAFDGDSKAASLSKLKNDISRSASKDGAANKVNEAFKQFERSQKRERGKLVILRNNIVAHVDFDYILNGPQESLTVEKILIFAEKIIDLVSGLARLFKKIGTVENPTVCDNSLVITPTKFAESEAEEFWSVTFSHWAH